MTSRIDLHMHSTASDGTDAPLQLAEKAKAAAEAKAAEPAGK